MKEEKVKELEGKQKWDKIREKEGKGRNIERMREWGEVERDKPWS